MVGLRLKEGCVVQEGESLYAEELVPWAAALSDHLLPSHCAACFRPCPTAPFPCPGPCHGALFYCSPFCRDLDLPLHFRSAECNLLSLLRSSSSPPSSFPSLGGTCDLRAALRLLAQHYSLHHVTQFLTRSCPATHGVCHPRLGGLLSNRSTLLQSHHSNEEVDEVEDEELQLASELQEAAMLMYHVCYSIPRIPEHGPSIHKDCCGDLSRHSSGPFEYSTGQAGKMCIAASGHLTAHSSANENVISHVGKCSAKVEHLDIYEDEHMDMCEGTQENAVAGMDRAGVVDDDHLLDKHEHSYTNAEQMHHTISLTHAQKMLLAEEVLCQVFTNAVKIQIDTWTANRYTNVQPTELGTAVYGPLLSWINHSCRPNAVYSFMVGGSTSATEYNHTVLVPDTVVKGFKDTWGLENNVFRWFERADHEGVRCLQHYSPRVRLRSIRSIKGPEPVLISYVDLLQPKNMRRQELRLKYRFDCTCERCDLKSIEGVDKILQTVGVYGKQFEMCILEEWLQEEVQRGLTELLENDNPLSCCAILEGALLSILYDAFQSCSDIESPQCKSQIKSLNFCGHRSLEVFMMHGRHVKVHLMHHLCLKIFMALSSSFKILASSCTDFSYKGSSNNNAIAMHSLCVAAGEIREVDCSMASAAYSLMLAITIQHLCDLGEPGLNVIAGRFWLQNWETVIHLIAKLDRYFCLDSMSEMQYVLSSCSSELKYIIFSPEEDFMCKLKDIPSTSTSLQKPNSTCQILQCSATALWPLLQRTSQFLVHIESPVHIDNVYVRPCEKFTGILETKDDWLHYRGEALICGLCSLRIGFYLTNRLYGSGEQLVEAMEVFLRLQFCSL